MKARPILMTGSMVCATLDGRKTQTRRIVKPQPQITKTGSWSWEGRYKGFVGAAGTNASDFPKSAALYCPYGEVGDLLWVRETFIYGYDLDENGCKICTDAEGNNLPFKIWYAASDSIQWTDDNGRMCNTPWKPSIHMPRWASRITLEITGVRVERLQDISEEDAIADGIEPAQGGWKAYDADGGYYALAVNSYDSLWESINGKGSWDANPWVWVIEFRPHFVNVGEYLREVAIYGN